MAVRAVVGGTLAAVSVAGTIWIDNPYVKMAAAAAAFISLYTGIGYATPVEPLVGNKTEIVVPEDDVIVDHGA